MSGEIWKTQSMPTQIANAATRVRIEREDAPAQGTKDVAGRGAADVAAQVGGGRRDGLHLGGGGEGGHHLPFDQGAMPGDQAQQHEAEQRHRAAGQGERPDERGVGVLLSEDHGDSHAGLDLSEVLAEHGAEKGGRDRDLQRAEDGGQRGDQAHLDELGEPAAAVDGTRSRLDLSADLRPSSAPTTVVKKTESAASSTAVPLGSPAAGGLIRTIARMPTATIGMQ